MPVFVFDYNHSGMLTFGLTAVYQGSAILLLAVLLASSGRPASGEGRSWAGRLLAPLSFLGFYSYSIYLWHIPVRRWLPSLLNRICGEKLPIGWELTAYLVASVVVGFGMAKLVEVPILRFRDRYFPSAARGSALTLAHPVTGTSESRVILAGDCEKPKRRLRIFVYSSALPRIDQNAGDRRFGALLQLLARNHDVDLCLGNNDGDPSNPPLAAGTEKYRRFLTGAGIRLTPFGWRHIESTLLRGDYDIGLFEFYYHARELLPLFRLYQPRARVIVDSVDVHFMRELAAADLGVMPRERAERTKRLELDTYRRADLVVALTGEDRRALEAEIQLPPIAVIPIIFPTRPRASGSRASEVLFVGGFHHLPNLDGLRWFLTEVWHRVLAVSPEARLTVIGSNAPPEVNDLAKNQGIQLLGYVPDINPYLDRAAVSVAPLRYGSGMKGKVIEAMASGLPVVSTTVGVQGLQSRPGQDVLVADDPEGFARGVIELLSNPARAQQLGLAGQRYIAGLCSPQVVAEAVEVALAIAMSRPVSGERTAWHIWRRFRFESLRLICFPYWGPRQGFRRYLKTPLCRLRNRFLRTSGR
jgi:glycosyltransferase involved in cell wall biosynthesis